MDKIGTAIGLREPLNFQRRRFHLNSTGYFSVSYDLVYSFLALSIRCPMVGSRDGSEFTTRKSREWVFKTIFLVVENTDSYTKQSDSTV